MSDILNPINPKYGVPVPLILTCNVSGKQVTWTNPTIIKAKIEAAGGLEAFLKSYVSRGATKKSKPSSSKTWGGKALGDTTGSPGANDDAPPKPRVTHRFISRNGDICTVTFPQQHPDQPLERTFDYRREGDEEKYAPKATQAVEQDA